MKPDIAISDFVRDVRDFGLDATIKRDSQPGISEVVEVVGPGENVFQFYSEAKASAPGFSKSAIGPYECFLPLLTDTRPRRV